MFQAGWKEAKGRGIRKRKAALSSWELQSEASPAGVSVEFSVLVVPGVEWTWEPWNEIRLVCLSVLISQAPFT